MSDIIKNVEEQIYQKRRTVKYDIRDFTVEMITTKYEAGKQLNLSEFENIESLDPSQYNCLYIPEYQRDFTWDENRQSKLIESVILGLPIPFIFVAENKNSSWEIVDGSQRIRTISNFISNSLTLRGLESLDKLNGLKYQDLEPARKGKILNTALRIIVLSEETTDEIKRDMFERINRGSDLLKPMEKRKGIYIGKFTEFIYKFCSENYKFKELVKLDKYLEKRQEREEVLLRFFSLLDNNVYQKGVEGGIASYMDSYLERKNAELEKLTSEQQLSELNKCESIINNVIEFVGRYFPYGFCHTHNPQTKRSVFEAISLGAYKYINDFGQVCNVDEATIAQELVSSEFKKFTHVANELHKKQKLKGRVDFIYNMLRVG